LKTWAFRENAEGELLIPDGFSQAFPSGSAVALGYFDGVHRGHRKLFSQLKTAARLKGVKTVAHTFSNTPKSKVFSTGGDGLITTLSERCSLIHAAGIEDVAVFPFSDSLSSMKAIDFLDEYVGRLLKATVVVAGEDYHFGANREGNSSFLIDWAKHLGIEAILVPAEMHEGRVISSSWIRNSILEGDMDTASKLLGRPVVYEGEVMVGRGLGGTLGFPTANIGIPSGKVNPAFGVYISLMQVGGEIYRSISNIGLRPTVTEGEGHPLIETMALGVTLKLYGEKISVYPIRRIREEQRFTSLSDLRNQIRSDVDIATAFHNDHPDYSIFLTDML